MLSCAQKYTYSIYSFRYRLEVFVRNVLACVTGAFNNNYARVYPSLSGPKKGSQWPLRRHIINTIRCGGNFGQPSAGKLPDGLKLNVANVVDVLAAEAGT